VVLILLSTDSSASSNSGDIFVGTKHHYQLNPEVYWSLWHQASVAACGSGVDVDGPCIL
jgi:hypothetical protein